MSRSALDRLALGRLLPVVVIDREEDAVPLAAALAEGGLPCIEITLRTPAARGALRAVRKAFPDFLVGAGTVLDAAVVPELVADGIDFAVAPGLDDRVVEACATHGLALTPGVVTPTEISRARSLGLSVLKFFPAEPAGGAKMVAALAAPFAHCGIRFVPTGGITLEKAAAYAAIPAVLAIGGSWFVDRKLYAGGDFRPVTEAVRAAVAAVRG